MWNIDSAPTVRATYLLEMCLEQRIIATYFTLPQQPIYHSSFCGNLLASPTLDVHPYYLCLIYTLSLHTLHFSIVQNMNIDTSTTLCPLGRPLSPRIPRWPRSNPGFCKLESKPDYGSGNPVLVLVLVLTQPQLRPSESPHKNWKVWKLCLRLLTYKWYWSHDPILFNLWSSRLSKQYLSISSGFNKLISPLNFERLSADNDICCDLGPDAVGRGHQPPRVDEGGAAVGGGADQPWDITCGHVMCHVINNQPITDTFIRPSCHCYQRNFTNFVRWQL